MSTPEIGVAYRNSICRVDGCSERSVAQKYCREHFNAALESGELGQRGATGPRERARTTCPDGHKHGASTTCYFQHQCRCDACLDNHHAVVERRRKLMAYGRWDSGLVDAAPVRDHMMTLGEFGIGYLRVAHLAGVSLTTTRNLIQGRQEPGPRLGELPKRVKRETAEKILAVKPELDSLAGGALVTARGAHRRLQALVARGWSIAKLAARLAMHQSNLSSLLRRDLISARMHREISGLFDELWDQMPPVATKYERGAYQRALGFAAARRWLPPLAWDDIDMDPEPPALEKDDEVDDIAVELALAGERVRLTPAERRVAVRQAHERRWSDVLTAKTIGCATETVGRIRAELELEAWPYEELEQAA